jgi:hypothetical protein
MDDDVIINTYAKFIKNELIKYKNIKKKIYNSDRDKEESTQPNLLSADDIIDLTPLMIQTKSFIDSLNEIDKNFKPIGIYNNYNLSNYLINKDGIIINSSKFVKEYKKTYFLTPLKSYRALRFSKKQLTDHIFAE